MKKFLFFLFFLCILYGGFSSLVRAAAGPVGSLYLDPSSGNQPLNQNFSVAAGVNVGSSNKINVVRLTITASSSLTIVSCTAASGFQGIAGQNPCTISGNTARVMVQAVNAEGPSGAVTFANVTLKGTANGIRTANFSLPEIVVKQTDGQSAIYQLANTVNGSYQIGSVTASNTPVVPTVTPGGTDQYTVPIGTRDELKINIGGGVTPSVTPVGPSITPEGPTPTGIVGTGARIRFGVKLFGAENTPDIQVRLTATDLIAQITPVPGQEQYGCETPGVGQYFYNNLDMTADANGIYHPVPGSGYEYNGTQYAIDAQGWVTLVDVASGKPISLAVKGPKQRNTKTENNILLDGSNKISTQDFDWTQTELEPGDLPDPNNSLAQDCTVNSIDISLAIFRIGATDQPALDVADVNFDDVVNGNDIAKIIYTLSTKPDDDR